MGPGSLTVFAGFGPRFCLELLGFLTGMGSGRSSFRFPFGGWPCFHLRTVYAPLPPCSGERFFGFLFVNGVVDRLNRRIFSYFSVFFSIFSFGRVSVGFRGEGWLCGELVDVLAPSSYPHWNQHLSGFKKKDRLSFIHCMPVLCKSLLYLLLL